MLWKISYRVFLLFKNYPRLIPGIVAVFVVGILVTLAIGKTYQRWDDDPDRGAIAVKDGEFGESYATPVYLEQGWDEADSLWFYNTTQGSDLIPYDFFLALEESKSEERLRSDKVIDHFRYLPQKATFFNPDALPVGFVKDTYQGKDYVGYTCAACHTGQVNYQGKAIRIDGGPAMADMVGFLTELQASLEAAKAGEKGNRFVEAVLALDNDYDTAEEVKADLDKWSGVVELYNTVNHSHIDYGYGRLDAFGRIYNRVLEHVLNKKQLESLLAQITMADKTTRLMTKEQIDKVTEGVNAVIVGTKGFTDLIDRLQRKGDGYPGLDSSQMLRVRDRIFNEPNAPVSYPFLWDIAQSDYVQWNGLASNAEIGPLGRNTGEVIGVFATLDWHEDKPFFGQDHRFSLSARISGQEAKREAINFKSSVDLVNLQRLEAHLRKLKSPEWPQDILGPIDQDQKDRGELVYAQHCMSCHEVIDRNDWDRRVIGKMTSVAVVKTDPAMATNSIQYDGLSGNFEHIYQETDGGMVVVGETAPVVQMLTAATRGVIATPDADKWFIRRWADWFYTLAISLTGNEIKTSVRSGDYNPATSAVPYAALLCYKARSLNGIWATAPYLHNGSVPTLYDLLLPAERRAGDPADMEYRPDSFFVGSREFDPERVGMRHEGYAGFPFRTLVRDGPGDRNTGHEYGTRDLFGPDGKLISPALTREQRWDLIAYLKSL